MTVYVDKIHCPAWSNIGYGSGLTAQGEYIRFVGDAAEVTDSFDRADTLNQG